MVAIVSKLQEVLSSYSIPSFCFKPQQIMCWEQLYAGNDVICVLPTGYGKSIIFQLLPDIMPTKETGHKNIVLVVSPLNSIIEDQIHCLRDYGITCGTLKLRGSEQEPDQSEKSLQLFDFTESDPAESTNVNSGRDHNEELRDEIDSEEDVLGPVPEEIVEGKCQLVFGHPEAYLSKTGRQLLCSKTYRSRVVAIALDEAHCVKIW